MIQIHTLTLGLYQTNCYIVHAEGSKSCVVIDPGYDANTILGRAALLGLEVEAILLTHGHFDHVGAVAALAADTDCRVFLKEEELSLPAAMTAGPLFYTDLYEGGSLTIAGMDSLNVYLLQPLYRRLAEEETGLALQILAQKSSENFTLVENREAGVGFAFHLSRSANVVCRPLLSEKMVWCATR